MAKHGPSNYSTVVKKDLRPGAKTRITSNDAWGEFDYSSWKYERNEKLRTLEIEQETTIDSPKHNPTRRKMRPPRQISGAFRLLVYLRVVGVETYGWPQGPAPHKVSSTYSS